MSKVYAALAGLVAALGMLLAMLLGARKAGKDSKQAEQMKETLDAVQDKTDLDRELDDPDARERLRDEHYRD